jgi:hypothetical protein
MYQCNQCTFYLGAYIVVYVDHQINTALVRHLLHYLTQLVDSPTTAIQSNDATGSLFIALPSSLPCVRVRGANHRQVDRGFRGCYSVHSHSFDSAINGSEVCKEEGNDELRTYQYNNLNMPVLSFLRLPLHTRKHTQSFESQR